MNTPFYAPMTLEELNRMKASHQALIDALEASLAFMCNELYEGENAAIAKAKAALKLAKGEA